jgi:hypothetical protein
VSRVLCTVTLLFLLTTPAWAEDCVYLADLKLKAVVEHQLRISHAMPTDMPAWTSLSTLGGLSSPRLLDLRGIPLNKDASVVHIRQIKAKNPGMERNDPRAAYAVRVGTDFASKFLTDECAPGK